MRRLFTLLLVLASPLAAQDTTAVKALVRRDSLDAVTAYNATRSSTVRAAMNRVKARTDTIYKALRKKDTTVVVTPPPPPPSDTTVVVRPDTGAIPPIAGKATLAELPRVSVDPAMPTGYNVVNVGASTSALQAAINAATCRTELRLAAGFAYSPISLPQKTCTERMAIIVRTNSLFALLPRGQRVTPALSAQRQQAKIVSADAANMSAITANGPVRGYYFEDIEIAAGGTSPLNSLVRLGIDQTTLAQVPGNFVFSHVYAHGTPTLPLRRVFFLNSSSTAIVDSWCGEAHDNNSDSQCILGLNGPGPYLIENNYLEASHEVVMFGGGDPSIPGLIPCDITMRRNHVTRPASWKGVWTVKNLLETKNACRMLVEGNVFENNWGDGQTGFGLLFKDVDQEGTAPQSTTKDLTVRYNILRNSGAGINLCAQCQPPSVSTTRVTIYDNLITGVNCGVFTGEAREWQFLGPLSHISVTHNTTLNACGVQTAVSFDQMTPKITNFDFRANAWNAGLYNIHGSGSSNWADFVDAATATWTDNLAYTSDATSGFDATGKYLGTGMTSDGRPLGANVALVYQKTAGVVVADPTRALARRTIASPQQSGWKPTSKADAERNTHGTQRAPSQVRIPVRKN